MSDDFVRDLERELTAAARRRAAAPGRRLPAIAPRRLLPIAVAALVAVALASVVALLARSDTEDRVAQPSPPAPTGTVPLLDAFSPVDCGPTPHRVASGLTDIALLRQEQRNRDPRPLIDSLPVRTFDITEMRQATTDPPLWVVPAAGVPEGDRCRSDEGPGVCLVELDRHFRCFPHAALARGEVLMRLSTGEVAGLAPDGISSVTLDGVRTPVRDNAYVAAVPGAGDSVRLAMEGAGCTHPLSTQLVARLPLLGEPREPLPPEGVAVLRDWEWNLDAIVTGAAAPWGERDGLTIWIVPVVSREAGGPCAPADGACLVVLPDEHEADANCWAPIESGIRWSPFPGGRSMILGVAENGATAVRVVSGDEESVVPVRDGVVAGLVPFPLAGRPVLETVR